jgi:hypothetical protein
MIVKGIDRDLSGYLDEFKSHGLRVVISVSKPEISSLFSPVKYDNYFTKPVCKADRQVKIKHNFLSISLPEGNL